MPLLWKMPLKQNSSMRCYLLSLLLMASVLVGAQHSEYRLTGDFRNIYLTEFIRKVEGTSPYHFYYLNQWTDSITVNHVFDNEPIRQALSKVFHSTQLQYLIEGNKVILTYNVPIIEGSDNALYGNADLDVKEKKNYSFLREYGSVTQELKKEETITEIGRKETTIGSGTAVLSGHVKDKKTGEPIPGVVISLQTLNKAVTTDVFGFYSIEAPRGSNQLRFQFIGMKPQLHKIILHNNGSMNVFLEEEITSLKEVVVESDREVNLSSVQMGVSTIDMRNMKSVPKVLGENDLLRVALTLPGVKSVGEAASGLNIRGGNADQNLMQLNEATIYNTSHFLGFFSIFNSDVIRSSELFKSGMPAQYGGRLSSVFDMQMKDGNQKKFAAQGGVGPVTAKLSFELPVIKDRTSVIMGGRTTYSDWIVKQINSLSYSSPSFYDFVVRVNHKLNDRNSLSATYYYSFDKFRLTSDSLFSYTNKVASLQWRHLFKNNVQSLLSLTNSGYDYSVMNNAAPEEVFRFGFNINESQLKWDFNMYRGRHKIDYGVQLKHYRLNPGYLEGLSFESLVINKQVERERALENAIYLADNYDITSKLSMYLGIRYSVFTALGPRTIYSYAGESKEETSVLDSTFYTSNSPVKTYSGPEYRMSARYALTDAASVKISYNRTRQYIHMLSNTVSITPLSTWKLSDPNVGPQIADQISAGFYRNLFSNMIEISLEVYYKMMKNVIDYKTGSELLLNTHIEQDIIQGKGKAYGFEFFLRKKAGKLNGWLGYTYSRTLLKMQSENAQQRINGGKYFPASYDKPHDFTFVLNYKITRRYSFSGNFVYNTGRPITYPIGVYQLNGKSVIDYSERNQFRIPDYIRMDLGFNIESNHKLNKMAQSFWSFSVYNVLGRRNPYSVFFNVRNEQISAYRLSIFGAPVPTITYNFKF